MRLYDWVYRAGMVVLSSCVGVLIAGLLVLAQHGYTEASTPTTCGKHSMQAPDANELYNYRAKVLSVYDGDTITLDIDLGLNVHVHERVRLARIDAPEVRGKEREAGIKARDWLRFHILGQDILITTQKDKAGKYGRYIVEAWHSGRNISDRMVEAGHAEYRSY